MVTGACNCGAVAFEIAADVSDVVICHCSICRRSTGSSGIAVVIVDNEDFHWVSGEGNISTWQKPGHDYQLWFCSRCGSPVPGVNDESRMFVPAGLISDGASGMRVADHVWVDSKAEWEEIGDAGRQHPEALRSSG